MWKLLAVVTPAVPLLSWYLIMLHKTDREYPGWLKRVFSNKWLESIVLSLAGLVVLWMIVDFRLLEEL